MNNTPRLSAAEKADLFKALHQAKGIFVIPNPWDVGSARFMEQMGFKALATTSAGLAYSLGKPDGHASITREETLANAQSIISATNLPVSADLENGYGREPEDCAKTIRLAAGAGLSGGSIEDATGNPDDPIFPFELSVERIKAAVKAARDQPFPFTLTARAENFLYGRKDLKDTIRRLEAFAAAGADVLFAPGLTTAAEIDAVVRAVSPKPISVIMGLSGVSLSLDGLEKLGVKRVSVGSSMVRAAYRAFARGMEEILAKGTFSYANDALPYAEMNKIFSSYQ